MCGQAHFQFIFTPHFDEVFVVAEQAFYKILCFFEGALHILKKCIFGSLVVVLLFKAHKLAKTHHVLIIWRKRPMKKHEQSISRRSFMATGALAGAGAIAAGAFTSPTKAYAVTSAQKRAEAQQALEKLGTLEEQLDEASADYGEALLEQETAQAKMDEAQAKIDEANEQIANLQDQLGTRARSMYRSGSLSFIDMLLGATSFQAFSTNWGVLEDMNESDTKMVEDTKQLRSDVEDQKAVYVEQEAVAAAKAEEAKVIQQQAQALVDEMQATYEALSAEAEELLRQEEEARRLEEQRQAEARARAAAAAAAANTGNSGGSTGGGRGGVNNSKPQTVDGATVVARAQSCIGLPYVWGAVGPNSYDCSGLVGYCLTGTNKRHWTTYSIYNWTQVTEPIPGDICIRWTHTGVYIGNGQMIHAPSPGRTVCVAPVPSNMFFVRY